MNKLLRMATLAILIWGTAESTAGPEMKIPPDKKTVNGLASWSKTVTFKGAERANVIVVGDGVSHLGLYIFDEYGNCVTRDDAPGGEFLDDRWVIWYPAKTQKYTIEVRNLGTAADTFRIAIR